MLAKSPSISVDIDDNISLNGKQGVLILLDGKRTYLSSKDLATLMPMHIRLLEGLPTQKIV